MDVFLRSCQLESSWYAQGLAMLGKLATESLLIGQHELIASRSKASGRVP